MRTYQNIVDANDSVIIRDMDVLLEPNVSFEAYRDAFYRIGKALGLFLNEKTGGKYGETMLACASEDADWLAHGVLDGLSQKEVSLAVFWNGRIMLDAQSHLEYSPILKSYVEPIGNCKTLILVKSIISTSCVVKTQLTRLVSEIQPRKIYIVAPVMYKDAEESLRKEFPASIADKFEFVTFAIDTERDKNQNIIPGIGGMVYPKLGLGNLQEKNKYMPELVKERLF